MTIDEVKSISKSKEGACAGMSLTVVKGVVYNVRQYLPYHPGGEKILKGVVGKDSTKLFEKHHAWVSAEGMLASCVVGWLKQDCASDDVETF